MIHFIPERYDSMSKSEKIKIGMICCDTCKTNCNTFSGADTSCIIPTKEKFAVRIIKNKLWKSVLFYEYKSWKPDIPVEYLPERLFDI